MIDVSYITAFVESISNVFSTMLAMQVEVQKPRIKQDFEPNYDVSGIIGLSGDVVGVVVLSFPTDVALGVAGQFTGMELEVESEDFADAIGELVNMVSGGAKAKFEGKQASISVPSVVVGKGHKVFRERGAPSIELPCKCAKGEFVLEVTLKEGK